MTLPASTTPTSAAIVAPWRATFVDAVPALAELFARLGRVDDPPLHVNRQPDVDPVQLPIILQGAQIAIVDHTSVPTEVAARCPGLKHIVFLGTGPRSYMDPEALTALGIAVHTIKGYGDTAVGECAFALMWAAARGLAKMDRELREGHWVRTDGMQLRGKTLGLIGFGGIAQELARMALGAACGSSHGTVLRGITRASNSSASTRCWRAATWCHFTWRSPMRHEAFCRVSGSRRCDMAPSSSTPPAARCSTRLRWSTR